MCFVQRAMSGVVRVVRERNIRKRSWRSNLVGLNEEFEFDLVSSNTAEHDEMNMTLRPFAAILGHGSRKAC